MSFQGPDLIAVSVIDFAFYPTVFLLPVIRIGIRLGMGTIVTLQQAFEFTVS